MQVVPINANRPPPFHAVFAGLVLHSLARKPRRTTRGILLMLISILLMGNAT